MNMDRPGVPSLGVSRRVTVLMKPHSRKKFNQPWHSTLNSIYNLTRAKTSEEREDLYETEQAVTFFTVFKLAHDVYRYYHSIIIILLYKCNPFRYMSGIVYSYVELVKLYYL